MSTFLKDIDTVLLPEVAIPQCRSASFLISGKAYPPFWVYVSYTILDFASFVPLSPLRLAFLQDDGAALWRQLEMPSFTREAFFAAGAVPREGAGAALRSLPFRTPLHSCISNAFSCNRRKIGYNVAISFDFFKEAFLW